MSVPRIKFRKAKQTTGEEGGGEEVQGGPVEGGQVVPEWRVACRCLECRTAGPAMLARMRLKATDAVARRPGPLTPADTARMVHAALGGLEQERLSGLTTFAAD